MGYKEKLKQVDLRKSIAATAENRLNLPVIFFFIQPDGEGHSLAMIAHQNISEEAILQIQQILKVEMNQKN